MKEETCRNVFGVRGRGVRHALLRNACKLGYPGLESRVAAERKLAASKEREKDVAEQMAIFEPYEKSRRKMDGRGDFR